MIRFLSTHNNACKHNNNKCGINLVVLIKVKRVTPSWVDWWALKLWLINSPARFVIMVMSFYLILTTPNPLQPMIFSLTDRSCNTQPVRHPLSFAPQLYERYHSIYCPARCIWFHRYRTRRTFLEYWLFTRLRAVHSTFNKLKKPRKVDN